MNRFFNSSICNSRESCKNCRLSEAFRIRIDKQFNTGVNFECPYGITKEHFNEENDEEAKSITNAIRLAAESAVSIVKTAVTEGKLLAKPETVAYRKSICEGTDTKPACKFFDKSGNKCSICRCPLGRKLHVAGVRCPKDYWGPEEKDSK